MKVFISWSGITSHQVALVLRNWIPKILHDIEPFVSSEDIKKGNIWNKDIIEIVNQSKFSIICVTKYNLNSQWLNFEAGALSKYNNDGNVCPFLYRMENNELKGPLTQFQTTVSEKNPEEIFSLLKSIRETFLLTKPDDKNLMELVIKFYDDLMMDLDRINELHREDLSTRSEKTEDPNSIFISTPMSSLTSVSALKENNILINNVIEELTESYSFNTIRCPAKNILNSEDFNDKEVAIVEDLKDLQRSEFFLCIYPYKIISSVLVEIGYAISKGKKSIILVKDREDLPFLLQEADKRVSNLKIYTVKSFEEIKKFLSKSKKGLFTFDRI